MQPALQNEYLKALGIDVFIPRRQHDRSTSSSGGMEQASDPGTLAAACDPMAGVVIGPGAGNLLLLCASSAEAATPLAADIARCLDCEPVWSWPAAADSIQGLPLELAIAEHLFTRIIIFGVGLGIDPGPRVMGSARLVQVESIPVLATSAAARKALWTELSASNWCAPRAKA